MTCGTPIAFYDNIPIISFLVLRGRCRDCKARFSARYLAVEIITALLFLASYVKFGLSFELVRTLVFLPVLIVIAFIDLDTNLIPNKLTYPFAVIGILSAAFISPAILLQSSVWALAAAVFLFVTALIKPGSMGMGDVKMALLMGTFLRVSVAPAMFAAFVAGSVTGTFLIMTGIKGRKDLIPFGPFLAFGSIAAVFFGQNMIDWYLSVF